MTSGGTTKIPQTLVVEGCQQKVNGVRCGLPIYRTTLIRGNTETILRYWCIVHTLHAIAPPSNG